MLTRNQRLALRGCLAASFVFFIAAMLAVAAMPFTETAWNMTERPPTTLKGQVVSWLLLLSGAAFVAGLVLQEYWQSENRPPLVPAADFPPEDHSRSEREIKPRALGATREQRMHG